MHLWNWLLCCVLLNTKCIRIALLLVALFSSPSVFASAGREIVWLEEVKISTGKTITVKRGEIRRRVAEPFQKAAWLFQEAWIEGDIPEIGRFRWETSLRPWLLDRGQDGLWYLIGMFGAYSAQYEYGLYTPRAEIRPRYVPFRLRNGRWERIVARDLPEEFMSPNLLLYGETLFQPQKDGPTHETEVLKDFPRGFSNGDKLTFPLKAKVHIPYGDTKRNFALARHEVDFGERFKDRCVLDATCGDDCSSIGGSCGRAYRLIDGKYGFGGVCFVPTTCGPKCGELRGRCEPVGQIAFDPNQGRSPQQRNMSR
jgi:hypothetical protein